MSGLFCFTTYHMSDIYEVLKKHLQIKLGQHILVCQGDVCNRAKGRTHILMDFFLFSKKELDKDQTKIFLNFFPSKEVE